MNNPLRELAKFRVSPWFDDLSRGLIASGKLERMVREDGLRGVTSNPTIFEKSIDGSADYDAAVGALATGGETDARRIFEALALEDIRGAADVLRKVFDDSDGADGFVSLEVSPTLAFDTEGTIHEAKRLRALAGRPNVLIKVPATKAGIPAVERLVGDGLPINVTLIFSLERYEAVMEAYLRGLERLASAGKPLSRAASVASFFVSRIDTAVDAQLKDASLAGKAAVANAKLAYELHKKVFGAARFKKLAKKGARVQRALWASTSVKNPAYRDVMYVEELIGPDTVNTMPGVTWNAFRDHGRLRASLEEDVDGARRVLRGLKKAGVDFAAVTAKLEEDGVKAFTHSYTSLLAHISAKAQTLRASGSRATASGGAVAAGPSSRGTPGNLPSAARATIDAAIKDRVLPRLWRKDASLWKKDKKHQDIIRDSLGWLAMPEWMTRNIPDLEAFAREIAAEKIEHVLLLGMGGSSLAPEVFRETFKPKPGRPKLWVLDSTDPEAVASAEKRCDPKKTLYVVSSKSGTTTEPLRLFDYFWSRAQSAHKSPLSLPPKGERVGGAGGHFVAITDPGSYLEKLAKEKGFRRVFANPADIGGRYSALSYFGIVPAALAGVDIRGLLDRARRMQAACSADADPASNPGLELGCALGALAKEGRDKVTFLVSPGLAAVGLWLEQLLAESTGKEGRGVVPISDEPGLEAGKYGRDRVFVHVRLEGDSSLDAFAGELDAAGQPVIRIAVADVLELGAEFYRWEIATAVLGWSLGIDPFDQPNVQEAKDRTKALLETLARRGALPRSRVHAKEGAIALSFSKASKSAAAAEATSLEGEWSRFLSEARPGDYAALLAYLSPWGTAGKDLAELRGAILRATGAPAQFGYGPRYLHSTGQLHKGGPNSGIFFLIAREGAPDVKIPGADYTFGQLIAAQSLGDFQALEAADRRAVLITVDGDPAEAVRRLTRVASQGRHPALKP